MTVLKQIIVIAVLALTGTTAWFAWPGPDGPPSGGAGAAPGPENGGRRAGAAPVVLAPVTVETAGTRIRAVGTGQAVQAVTLHPEAAGTVREILFGPGDRVEAGDVLVRLDEEDQRLAVDLARSELANAQRSLERFEQLRPSGAASAIELDAARTTLVTARNRLAAAELALTRRVVRAPFAGVVGLTDVETGSLVTTSTPLTTLDDRSSILVTFELPERYAGRIAPGQAVTATTAAFANERFDGVVHAVDSRIGTTTRTLTVRARIPNPDDRLRPGMAFAVTLEFTGLEYPAVPELAVQWDNRGSFVWRIVEGTARRVPVTIVERRDGITLIEGDLSAGERVVVEGVQRMRDGAAVAPLAETGTMPGNGGRTAPGNGRTTADRSAAARPST
jgi:RND family efflux transporter MFP subunit